MTEGTFHYRPEPLGKRVVAWFLLFSFFLQCAPVAAWALPDPQPVHLRQTPLSELIPRGMPTGVAPRLPNPLAGIPDLPQQDMLAADFPDPESVPTPEATQTPQPSQEPAQPRRFRVTPENLRAREQKRLEAEALAEKKSHSKKNGDGEDASAHDGQDSEHFEKFMK